MRNTVLFFSMSLAAVCAAGDVDYSTGVFFVNEDWYGHQNSTVNYLLPDAEDGENWHYRVIQAENPGMELGCTNQYGAIHDGRFFLIAKQERDPGAAVTGGRITVVDAATMKILHQSALIDPSGNQCDGRAFCGIDAHKGYVSTSNGIWILDLDDYSVKGQVEGSQNPNAGDDKPNTDPTGSLYHGQTGTMVLAEGRVFAVHQQYGLLVIDPVEDKVIEVIDMGIVNDAMERDTGTAPKKTTGIGSTIVRSKDGDLWYAASKNVQGTGSTVPYIVRIDPATLETEVVPIQGEGMYPPSNSWYAWTPDPFCASKVTNSLYWCGGSNSWFSNYMIFRFDIDSRTQEKLIDFSQEDGDWHVYGCSLGIHPETDEIYTSLFHKFGDPTYITRRYDSDGRLIREYSMITNYWFPSLPVFPVKGGSGIEAVVADEPDTVDNDIYNMQGVCVKRSATQADIDALPSGLYIIGGRKVVVR